MSASRGFSARRLPGLRAGGSASLVAIASALLACSGGGGGGGGSYDKTAELLAILFPDPNDVNAEAEDAAPNLAPLVQQVVFNFSGRPDPNRISISTVQIRDASGFPVPGTFTVDGTSVTFTPALPTRPFTVSGSGAIDTGGTGLQPASSYSIRLGPRTFSFVAMASTALRAEFPDPLDPKGVLVGFKTTADAAVFFAGLPAVRPQLVRADPRDGTTGVSPGLYTDPDRLFPPERSFTLTFDRPISPGVTNVSDGNFQLIDLDHPSGGLSLGVDVTLTVNELNRSVVTVTPSGILPFGSLLALEHRSDVKGLSEAGVPTGPMAIASTFTIAQAPAATIHDRLTEDFHTAARQEGDVSLLGTGVLPADWDRLDSDILQAAFTFQGDGVLGRFIPPAPPSGQTKVITLDTTRQVFPLPDGSTPDAPPGFEVIGGVFPFTEIDIPDGVVVKPLGSKPLVLSATGSVRIAGDILLAGEDGTPENAYDSAVTSVPGGAGVAGGGRGGESHPILFFPPDQINYLTLVSPLFGGTGFGIDPADGVMKRIGGVGGQCGCLDESDSKGKYGTDQEINCSEFRTTSRPEKVPGGGGGSLLVRGNTPGIYDKGKRIGDANGIGNVKPDGTGKFTVDDDRTLLAGVGGRHPFFDDGNANNDFYGKKGQLTELVGGQGGGGGASLTESYYCGDWCRADSDPGNDKACYEPNADPFVKPNKTRAGSVGDARGGGGGGGGGALLIQALGPITLTSTALIDAHGGAGMGGEAVGCSYWGGGGGGGSGGAVILQSGTSILIPTGAQINVSFGVGDDAENDNDYFSCDNGLGDGNGNGTGDAGDGGNGGAGLIQLQVPGGETATVVSPTNSLKPLSSWVDPTNTLNPSEFTPVSMAVSKWFDLGRVTARPPAGTNPVFSFGGLDVQGFVITNADGTVASPSTTDIVCSYMGQRDPLTNYKLYKKGEEPRGDFIPTNAKVRVEFQGANAIAAGSKEVDPGSLTAWSSSPTVASSRQFLRWRITFDVTADGSLLAPNIRLPAVQSIQVHADF